MKLLIWNIQHGVGARIARIVEEIAAHDADMIALTEFRARPGIALCPSCATGDGRRSNQRTRPGT